MARGGRPGGRYRTKIEVLRDIVRAASTEERKTRIIGLANLNQGSFQRYYQLGLSLGLLVPTATGVTATRAADEWLTAVDSILSKSSELSAAIDTLNRLTLPVSGSGGIRTRPRASHDAVQLLARLAWTDLRSTGRRTGDGLPPLIQPHLPTDRPIPRGRLRTGPAR